jgi:hypothetical protein
MKTSANHLAEAAAKVAVAARRAAAADKSLK